MKKWLCIVWCFIGAPLSFFIGWVHDWSIGGAMACWIGLIGGTFLFISAILLICNKISIAKYLGMVGCGINLGGYVIVCAMTSSPSIASIGHCLIVLLWYSPITIIPFLLFLNIKSS